MQALMDNKNKSTEIDNAMDKIHDLQKYPYFSN